MLIGVYVNEDLTIKNVYTSKEIRIDSIFFQIGVLERLQLMVSRNRKHSKKVVILLLDVAVKVLRRVLISVILLENFSEQELKRKDVKEDCIVFQLVIIFH